MYGQQQARLLEPQPSLSVALASAETRPCPCCPASGFIYNRYIGGYTITLILQWLSLIFLITGSATPALFVVALDGTTVTYGLFHACVVNLYYSRSCYTYEGQGATLLGSTHLSSEWQAFQGLTVTLTILTFAIAILYALRMAIVQRSKVLSRRTELSLIAAAAVVLLLSVVSLFISCYSAVTLVYSYSMRKTFGSSFTLSAAAYILQLSALLFHCYTYYRHTKANSGTVGSAAAGVPEPVAMGAVANPMSAGAVQYQQPSYAPAAAAYMPQPAFYGQAYQLPPHQQQYAQHQQPQQQAVEGGGLPSYYSPPQYYAPSQQPQPQQVHAYQQYAAPL